MRVRQRDAARYPLRPLREERAIQPPVSAGQGEFTVGHMHSYDALMGFRGLMFHHGPRSAPPDWRPLKKKGVKEKRGITSALDDIGISTPLESNKSLLRFTSYLTLRWLGTWRDET